MKKTPNLYKAAAGALTVCMMAGALAGCGKAGDGGSGGQAPRSEERRVGKECL